MNHTSEHPENSKYLDGIHEKVPQNGRILLPKEWRGNFPNDSEVILLYDGHKIICIPSTQTVPTGIIQHRVIIKSDMIRPPSVFYKSHRLSSPSKVWMVGMGNHIEIYTEEEKLTHAKAESMRLVGDFQQELLSKL